MKIKIKARPGAKKAEVHKLEPNIFRVKIDAPAKENKANIRLLEIIADHFNVSLSCVRFISGLRSKTKVLEIDK